MFGVTGYVAMLEALIFVVFPFCMVFAAISDTLSMTIANRVPLLLLAVFLVVAPLTGMAWADIGMHLAAGALLLCVTFALFALGGMGGGDAKLIAATGVWMGFGIPLMQYLLVSAAFGGLLTLAILSYRGSALAACYRASACSSATFPRTPAVFPMASRSASAVSSPIPSSPLMALGARAPDRAISRPAGQRRKKRLITIVRTALTII